jgi:hypothetical protein
MWNKAFKVLLALVTALALAFALDALIKDAMGISVTRSSSVR